MRSSSGADELYRMYFENTNVGLYTVLVTQSGQFIYEDINPEHQRATGLTAEGICGKEPWQCLPPDVAEIVTDHYCRCVTDGRTVRYEETLTLPAGTRHWQTSLTPVRDGTERIVRLLGSCHDITELKQRTSELTHLTRVTLLGELCGALAHELQQPLTAIMANAEAARQMLAQECPDLGVITGVLDDIVEEDNRAGEVIHRLRGLLNKGDRKFEPLDLNELVVSTLHLVHAELINRRTKIDTKLGEHLPPVAGDWVHLQQVLLNLLLNASDAMTGTTPSERLIRVRTRLNAGYVEVVVDDRGHGITPEHQERLFQPFFTTKPNGLGLGLSICATIVMSHGGELRLANIPAGGAMATLKLPAHGIQVR